MDGTDSSPGGRGSGGPHLPPGFRFHPTDEELVVHYLKRKAQSAPLPVSIIAEIDLYKFDPWELPAKATFGEQEWYFFSPRDRKYPNGARPNRAATSGYWKATGTDKPVLTSGGTQKVGVKKALVFYGGKPPRGVKTDWIMHEYRLISGNKPAAYDPTPNKRSSLRLDDWVLCRIYKKNTNKVADQHEESMKLLVGRSSVAPSTYATPTTSHTMTEFSHHQHHEHHLFDEMLAPNADNASSQSITHPANTATNTAMADLLPLGESVFRQPYQISGLGWY